MYYHSTKKTEDDLIVTIEVGDPPEKCTSWPRKWLNWTLPKTGKFVVKIHTKRGVMVGKDANISWALQRAIQCFGSVLI